MAEKKDNTLVLFTNDKKEQAGHPDSKGQGMVDGVEYWVSAWRNEAKSGQKYLKISLTRKDRDANQDYPRTRETIGAQRRPEQPFGDEQHFKEDDIPF